MHTTQRSLEKTLLKLQYSNHQVKEKNYIAGVYNNEVEVELREEIRKLRLLVSKIESNENGLHIKVGTLLGNESNLLKLANETRDSVSVGSDKISNEFTKYSENFNCGIKQMSENITKV